ncbi:CDP-diacylglycerol--glycerol-3-phosphate 3-phosphatidyltransferase [Marimonas arenosa]|uniref:CDP-diacylglycerol--glycerol-3-phosphate 3-phosphatidyltransferase n=1 Tax=Marimonas arenosa TaxID=1795305 RepID=A0AAE4B5V1_9RHOB|nr:CDP-diacylglycerol--glycerol-3-phosphate 3-phosphatidyltransferase [Marimonas arenosa]MDQ2091730.1 CDP-diacylglycerol--glycerol-3-phosphate 3-phosphatidyltransferase [Marimonas arenosa]
MTWTIPNILTALRLLAAPMVPVMFLYFTRPYADWFALLLFVGASVTDWFDGYLARAWKQQTKIGTMLDPIADKAMVVIALLVICGYSTWTPWLVLPATIIIFREVFVSGLREFLGDTAGTLAVTNLAKWKTTLQMVAIAVLFSQGIFEHQAEVKEVAGDLLAEQRYLDFRLWAGRVGVGLLWFAALLTLVTGWEYFRKALPYLREDD